MFSLIIEILGWIGSICIIIAYMLNLNKKLAVDSVAYYALNIVGSGLLIVNTAWHHAYPSMAINIVWVIIPVVTIVRARRGAAKKADQAGGFD